MNTKEIEQLLEQFFDGETSLDDERKLREWFRQNKLPPHHQSLKAQFEYFEQEAAGFKLGNDFETRLMESINKRHQGDKKMKRRQLIFGLSGIAALLVIGLGLFMQYRPVAVEDSFNDPAKAYQEIQKAIFFVSDKLNMGLQPAQKAATDFNEGIEQASRISKLHEVQNFFVNE